MSDIETFLAKQNLAAKQKKGSVLEPYRAEIMELKERGYSDKVVVQFLAEMKGVKVSQQWLNRYIRSQNATITPQQKNETVKTETDPSDQPQKQNQEPQGARQKPNGNNIHLGKKKFEWPPTDVDVNDLI